VKGRESPYRVERNPWTTDVELLRVLQARGGYVAAMGHIETTLTELAIRASKHPAYGSIRQTFPTRRPDRLKFLQEVCERDGPLRPYRTLLRSIITRFEHGFEIRDYLSHGRMRILSGPGDDASLKFEDYYANGAALAFRMHQTTCRRLEADAHRMAGFSRAVDRLYARLGPRLPAVTAEFHRTIENPQDS
jgi:hypothetical protein